MYLIEKLQSNSINLNKFLWKKRILLISESFFNNTHFKSILTKSNFQIKKNKIIIIYFNSLNKPKEITESNVVLIGLDGLIKYKSNKFDLKKIISLISKMPMANFQ